MSKLFKIGSPAIALLVLSACSSGSRGGELNDLTARFNALNDDPSLSSLTADSTVDTRNSSASYSGVINVSTDDIADPTGAKAYYGNLDVTVDFRNTNTTDAMAGSADGFVQYFSENSDPKTGSAVPGSMTIAGNLTGDNENLSDGILGTATGTIDGTVVSYDVDGNIVGDTGNGVILYLDGSNPVSTVGVGIAVE